MNSNQYFLLYIVDFSEHDMKSRSIFKCQQWNVLVSGPAVWSAITAQAPRCQARILSNETRSEF